mmetsp:Transcript_8759/g.15929  ORF Transcript_8759/g.15929 Transcript_8759/m.15929 type:complete len:128 (-) Transcript_8759:730-1113(-)
MEYCSFMRYPSLFKHLLLSTTLPPLHPYQNPSHTYIPPFQQPPLHSHNHHHLLLDGAHRSPIYKNTLYSKLGHKGISFASSEIHYLNLHGANLFSQMETSIIDNLMHQIHDPIQDHFMSLCTCFARS